MACLMQIYSKQNIYTGSDTNVGFSVYLNIQLVRDSKVYVLILGCGSRS